MNNSRGVLMLVNPIRINNHLSLYGLLFAIASLTPEELLLGIDRIASAIDPNVVTSPVIIFLS
jgi:hypothetical protein